MKRTISALFFTLLLTVGGGGCWTLPSGAPPQGEIVPATQPRPLSSRGIENMLVTSLTGYLLSQPGPFVWRLDCEPELLPLVADALQQLHIIAPIRLESSARTILRAWNDDGLFRFELVSSDGSEVFWSESAVPAK